MKNAFIILFLLYSLSGCNDRKSTLPETVTTYYNARDSGNYAKLKTVLSDSVTITAGDYVMPYDHDSFYEQFKWDSVFKTSYKIIELEEQNDQVIVIVAQDNVRNAFLKNNPLTSRHKISFTSGEISKIEELAHQGVAWDIWEKERDSLVRWIEKNHPELDGFINDMTMKGALNYVKAIELYTTDRSALK